MAVLLNIWGQTMNQTEDALIANEAKKKSATISVNSIVLKLIFGQ